MLDFISDWRDGPDRAKLAASYLRLLGIEGHTLVLGQGDGEQSFARCENGSAPL
jgi:hypothetical protein